MSDTAFTRADIDLHQSPSATASIIDRLPTNCLVEILETQEGWYKVKPAAMQRSQKGYVPAQALIFPPAAQAAVFPNVTAVGKPVASVPVNLPLAQFQQWHTGSRPAWLPEPVWNGLTADQQTALTAGITASIAQNPELWDRWTAEVTANNRTGEAVMDEWSAIVSGGREVFAIRDHYVYKQPVQDANYYGCAMKGQVLRWTGSVRSRNEGGTLRTFYEVQFYRMSRAMTGWFRADLAAAYVYPAADIDPAVEANKVNVFDLAQPLVRIPQDHEMADAKAMHYTGAQYIDLRDVLNRSLRHFCLCGEFCVAALCGRDIIPVLKDWCASGYWRVQEILGHPQEGTGTGDLQNLLKVTGLQGELYSSMPTTPQQIKQRLDSGQLAIASCGINSAGVVKADGHIRHWVVLEDVRPVGNSGWVRIYNPFNNQEEVYPYDLFMTSGGIGTGLWVSKN